MLRKMPDVVPDALPEEVDSFDRLSFTLAWERLRRAQTEHMLLTTQLAHAAKELERVNTAHNAEMGRIRSKYRLLPEDSIDTDTGRIARAAGKATP